MLRGKGDSTLSQLLREAKEKVDQAGSKVRAHAGHMLYIVTCMSHDGHMLYIVTCMSHAGHMLYIVTCMSHAGHMHLEQLL